VRASKLHLAAMYASEVVAAILMIGGFLARDIAILLVALAMVAVTCTLHVTYLLSCIYELLSQYERYPGGGENGEDG